MNSYSAIWVRADARPSAGMGHLYRCLNLAEALRPDFTVTFLLDDEVPRAFLERLAASGIGCHDDSKAFDDVADQIVILDGYDFEEGLYAAASLRRNVVVAIDDLAERAFDCDLVVCHGPHRRQEDFRVAPRCRLLLGPEYALINPCFYGADYAFRPEVRRVLVGFGGSDPVNATALVARLFAASGLDLQIVVGAGYDVARDLPTVAPHATVHRALQQDSLATLMKSVDAAIASPGGMSYELGAIGVPCLLFAIADNQEAVGAALEERDLARYGGRWPLAAATIADTFTVFCADATRRHRLHERCREVFRDSGIDRVATAIWDCVAARRKQDRPEIIVRPAHATDVDLIFAWRNDAVSRAMSRQSAPLDLAAHRSWFTKALRDEQRLLLIGEAAGVPFGSVRFDRMGLDEADISVAIAPEQRGHGLGTRLIAMALPRAIDRWALRTIVAEIRNDNIASTRAFEANGFVIQRNETEFSRYARHIKEFP